MICLLTTVLLGVLPTASAEEAGEDCLKGTWDSAWDRPDSPQQILNSAEHCVMDDTVGCLIREHVTCYLP